MRPMHLVGIRSTQASTGLVAILVEAGGPGMIAVPVTAREGLVLSEPAPSTRPDWVSLLARSVQVLGGSLLQIRLGVDADARLVCGLAIAGRDERGEVGEVPCAPGDALVLASALDRPILASETLLRLRGVDLGEQTTHERMARWRRSLATAIPEEPPTR
ncbi:bifunctional nuclease [Actinomyces marmotae]|uniref:Bifunctional nuclease n=2 Tax=Actinomycetaceae TaxID=2049 RepID=A0A6M8B1M6_9ACTO|nr:MULTISPECIES: DUF151 domain-containing protein [Actinomyces]QKD79722.1 bifunctional nuclease [Actinomyces marmotae]